MIYTVRFAHLSDVYVKPGQVVKRGMKIGKMGGTGAVDGDHLHLDDVEGAQAGRYTLANMASGRPKPDPRQASLFIDKELFGVDPAITTFYYDPRYYKKYAKWHPGYDVVPLDRHAGGANFDIRWNRSMDGKVSRVVENDPGYGNYVLIVYEVY